MKEGTIVRFHSNEELARFFSNEVVEEYLSHLEYWQATTLNESKDYIYWQYRKEQVDIVRKNVFEKILKVLQDSSNKTYSKKVWLGYKNKNIISITKYCGFYDGLLQGVKGIDEDSVKYAIAVNAEYILNRKNHSITRKIYSQNFNF